MFWDVKKFSRYLENLGIFRNIYSFSAEASVSSLFLKQYCARKKTQFSDFPLEKMYSILFTALKQQFSSKMADAGNNEAPESFSSTLFTTARKV